MCALPDWRAETPFPVITITRNRDCVYTQIQRYSGYWVDPTHDLNGTPAPRPSVVLCRGNRHCWFPGCPSQGFHTCTDVPGTHVTPSVSRGRDGSSPPCTLKNRRDAITPQCPASRRCLYTPGLVSAAVSPLERGTCTRLSTEVPVPHPHARARSKRVGFASAHRAAARSCTEI